MIIATSLKYQYIRAGFRKREKLREITGKLREISRQQYFTGDHSGG